MKNNADNKELKSVMKRLIEKKDTASIVTKIETGEHLLQDYIPIFFDLHPSKPKMQKSFSLLMGKLLEKFPGELIRALSTQIESDKNTPQKNGTIVAKSYFIRSFNEETQYLEILTLLEKCILLTLDDFRHQIKSICEEYIDFFKDLPKYLKNDYAPNQMVLAIYEVEMELYSISGGKLSENQAKKYKNEALSNNIDEEIIVKFNKYLKDKTEQKSDIQAYLEKVLENQPISLALEDLDIFQKKFLDWDQFITKFIQELSRLVSPKTPGIAEVIIFLINEYGPRFILKLNNVHEIFEKLLKHGLHQDVLRIIKECLSEFQYRSFESIVKDTIPYIMETFKKEFKEDFQILKNKSLRVNIYESIENLPKLDGLGEIAYGSKRRLMCDIITLLDQIHSYEPSKKHETQYLDKIYKSFSEQLLTTLEDYKPLYVRDKFTHEPITAEEDVNTEFKKSLLPLENESPKANNYYCERLEEAICSMLNAEGGIIYLGIDDKTSKVIGGDLNRVRFETSLKQRLGNFDIKTIPQIEKHISFKPIKLNTQDKLKDKHIVKIFVQPTDTTMFVLRESCFYRGDGTTINLFPDDIQEIRNQRKITRELYQMDTTERESFLPLKLRELVKKKLSDNIFKNYDEKSQFVIEMVKFQQEMKNSKEKDNVMHYQNIQKYLIQDFTLLSPKHANLEQRNTLYFGEYLSQESPDSKYQDLQLQHEDFLATDLELKKILEDIKELQSFAGGRIYFGIDPNSYVVKGIDLSRKERDNFKSGLCHKIYQIKKIIPNKYVKIYFIPLVKFYSEEIIPGKFVIKIVVKAKVTKEEQDLIKGEILPERIFVDPLIDSSSIKDRTDLQGKPREFIKEYVNKEPQIITV